MTLYPINILHTINTVKAAFIPYPYSLINVKIF